ncbi:MAG: recombination mediator RecR [Anaerolineae bacterium]|nr:recombination mediator RecR [Anaerolineae bacterium]MDQ7033660.1 recombination mediator RecR [Anaerolineae bacterium]
MSNAIPEPVTKLIEALGALPGIGPKTASRLTYFLLRAPSELSTNLADALHDLKTKTTFCSNCGNITVDDPCPICSNANRDHRTIAVVEEPLDLIAIERTGTYDGAYHVLHGVISPVNGVGPDDLNIAQLIKRLTEGNVLEVILATNPGMEGDATAMYLRGELTQHSVKITRPARGLPTGGDLEYVDTVTLMRALQGRSEM